MANIGEAKASPFCDRNIMIKVIHYTKEDKRLYDLYHYLFRYEDGVLIRKVATSNSVKVGDVINSVAKNGYIRVTVESRRIYAHQVIYHMHHGYCPEYIDHIDQNKINNRINNLREATNKENSCNTPKLSGCTSKFKGVYWHKSGNKWNAKIKTGGKAKSLGMFLNEGAAALAYSMAAEILFGKFAFQVKFTPTDIDLIEFNDSKAEIIKKIDLLRRQYER